MTADVAGSLLGSGRASRFLVRGSSATARQLEQKPASGLDYSKKHQGELRRSGPTRCQHQGEATVSTKRS